MQTARGCDVHWRYLTSHADLQLCYPCALLCPPSPSRPAGEHSVLAAGMAELPALAIADFSSMKYRLGRRPARICPKILQIVIICDVPLGVTSAVLKFRM